MAAKNTKFLFQNLVQGYPNLVGHHLMCFILKKSSAFYVKTCENIIHEKHKGETILPVTFKDWIPIHLQ